jgi:hypothetical protein
MDYFLNAYRSTASDYLDPPGGRDAPACPVQALQAHNIMMCLFEKW